jgi:hypothetical protein
MNNFMSKLGVLEKEKKELTLKNCDLMSDNKKLSAENQVLEKTLEYFFYSNFVFFRFNPNLTIKCIFK